MKNTARKEIWASWKNDGRRTPRRRKKRKEINSGPLHTTHDNGDMDLNNPSDDEPEQEHSTAKKTKSSATENQETTPPLSKIAPNDPPKESGIDDTCRIYAALMAQKSGGRKGTKTGC